MRNIFLSVLLFAVVTPVGAESEPDKDPRMLQLLNEARTLIDSKHPQSAIEKCDKVIAAFKAAYGSRKEKIYCARSSAESSFIARPDCRPSVSQPASATTAASAAEVIRPLR